MEREKEILAFWKERGIFEKTLKKDSPKGEFVFYEGPPTANGRPGIHHLEARAFKDAIPRYRTMRGYHVRRKAGWDTHGLPVELEVEKELGLKSKKEIESYGIAKFNEECKKSVWKYLDEWRKFTDRIGFWVDQKHPYVTYHNSYIESLWHILAQVDGRGLLYKDYKVVPWCPRCGTALSSHELAQGYEEVKDLSLYVKFKVKGEENTYLLAWTTTPWTLPGNVALAVNPSTDYVKVLVEKIVDSHGLTHEERKEKLSSGGELPITLMENPPTAILKQEILIFAKERFNKIKELGGSDYTFKVIEEVRGNKLVGREYKPLHPFIKEAKPKGIEKAYKVYPADFVTTEDGTGIVHTAVMYGADDFELGTKIGLPKHHLVGEDGRFIKGTGFLEGRLVTETDVAVDILKDLEKRGLFFKKEPYTHSYPFCWRCKSKLIYFARDSWYIRMSALREKLVSENQSINWEPAHTRDGRFGEWLREVKDWAISRERYWGTPLPVWETKDGAERLVVDSIDTLKRCAKRSGNRYFVMRHGLALSNQGNFVNSTEAGQNHLTKEGEDEVRKSAQLLGEIDLIFTSPLLRAKETARIVKEILGLPDSAVIADKRLSEIAFGSDEGKPISEYLSQFKDDAERFSKAPEGGETQYDVRRRMGEFLYELERKHSGKKILVVSHGDPLWLMAAVAEGLDAEETIALAKNAYPKWGKVAELEFSPLPHNENYELDLHRPYIDEIVLIGENKKEMRRVKEVMDVWFDSGGMPFAQDHYPFGAKKIAYPADFICEAIDQTRGWFYTLHAEGVLTGRGKAYKNAISLGHILDKDGKKMSKSLGNTVDPWQMIEKYGADVLRFWMYSVNQAGESKNFDEKTIDEAAKRVFGLLSNVHSFYELYRDTSLETKGRPSSSNALDQWVMARLDEVVAETTSSLDAFRLLEPTRAIRKFIDDLSTWYLRRSRERIKGEDREAKATLYFTLKTLAKLLAPFAPFTAEDMHRKLRTEGDEESVHLEAWPEGKKADVKMLMKMENTRRLVELALAKRAEAGIKVRQPLAALSVDAPGNTFFAELVKEEVNVKEVKPKARGFSFGSLFGKGEVKKISEATTVTLDTAVTPELKREGQLRDLTRAIQELRKENKLTPRDKATLSLSGNQEAEAFARGFAEALKKATLLSKLKFEKAEGKQVVIDRMEFTLSIKK